MRLYLREADFNMLTELAERTTIMSKMDIGIYVGLQYILGK